MKKWKLWIGIVVIFLSGAVLGVTGTIMYVHHHIRSMVKEGPNAFNRLVVGHLDHELDLSADQEAAVLRVVVDTHARLLHYRKEHEPHLHGIIEEGIARIKEHLDAPQRDKADRIFREIMGDLHHGTGHGRHDAHGRESPDGGS